MAGEEACGPLLDGSGPSKMGRPAFWLVDRREKKKKQTNPNLNLASSLAIMCGTDCV